MSEEGYVDYNLSDEIIDMGPWNANVQADDGRPKFIDPGVYEFEIKDATIKEAKSSGKPTLVIQAVVVNDCPMKGRVTRKSYSLQHENEWCVGRLRNILEACNVPIDTSRGRFSFSRIALRGAHFIGEIVMKTSEFNDPRNPGQTIQKELSDLIGETRLPQAQSRPVAQKPVPTVQAAFSPPPSAPPATAQATPASRPMPPPPQRGVVARRSIQAPPMEDQSGNGGNGHGAA